MQAKPISSAGTERILFAFHVLLLLLGLGVCQPQFWHVQARCWDAFLVVSALYHFDKVSMQQIRCMCVSPVTLSSYDADEPSRNNSLKLSKMC